MLTERIAVVVAALLVLALTGLTSAPPVWASGVSPMGFFVGVMVVSLYKPEALPVWVIAVLSLLQDAAVGAPFGFNGMVALLAVMLMARRARAYQRQTPWFVWAVLAAYLLLVQLMFCALAGLFGLPVSLHSAVLSWLVTLPFVPVLQWGVVRMMRVSSTV